MRRGDVFWADLKPRRPVIVVSHPAFTRSPAWRSIMVVPVATANLQQARGPSVVPLPPGAGSLPRPGLALCHHVMTLDRARLVHRIGTLAPEYVLALGESLKAALDLE
jgi:mRNA-degrading endonuclease toxin of MazEF toxin-antitoxin module